jgi:hypothetical protein
MRKVIYLLLLAASIALAMYFYHSNDQARLKLAETYQRLAEQDRLATPPSELDTAAVVADDTLGFSPPPSALFEDEIGTLTTTQTERLRRQGLRNPETDLLNDLHRKQRTLIPTEGVLGGTMAIRDARILTDRYAIAYYEDGHIGGYMVLRYQVQPGGIISWQVIDSYRI